MLRQIYKKIKEKESNMKKSKRIMALIGAILLVLLYVSTLIFAFIDSVVSQKLLMAAIAATILLPVLLYIYTLFSRTSHTDDSDSNE